MTIIKKLNNSIVFIFFIFLSTASKAQFVRIDSASNWRKEFRAGLNLNQASFSQNWKAGGVNSIGYSTFLNYKIGYKKKVRSWSNELDLLYGMVNSQGLGYRKVGDRIYFDSRYGRAINNNWDFIFAFNLLTQFAQGFNYNPKNNQATLISSILAPCFITLSVGFEYRPVSYFKIRLSPLSPRITIVSDAKRFVQPGKEYPYGVAPDKSLRYEFLAASVLAEFDKDILKNMNLKWRYQMFANYSHLDPTFIDHRLDLTLSAKVNKFVNVSFGTIAIYDFDQDTELQLSQAFTLGVVYTFKNFDK